MPIVCYNERAGRSLSVVWWCGRLSASYGWAIALFLCRFCGLPKIICIISIRIYTPFPSFNVQILPPPFRLRFSVVLCRWPIKRKARGATWAGFFFIGGLREYYSIAAAVRHGRRVRLIILVILVILGFSTAEKALCIKGFRVGLLIVTPRFAHRYPLLCSPLPPHLLIFAPLFEAVFFLSAAAIRAALRSRRAV